MLVLLPLQIVQRFLSSLTGADKDGRVVVHFRVRTRESSASHPSAHQSNRVALLPSCLVLAWLTAALAVVVVVSSRRVAVVARRSVRGSSSSCSIPPSTSSR